MQFSENDETYQELMQKWKIHIDCEKVAQINVFAKKMIFQNYDYEVQTIYA